MCELRIGVQVTHRRYPWMIGFIEAEGEVVGSVKVYWRCSDPMAHPHVELLADLRVTPVQPNPNAFSDHIHDTVATAYGNSSTRRCNSV